MFVVQRQDGKFLKKAAWWHTEFGELQEARTYRRRCDASNSMKCVGGRKGEPQPVLEVKQVTLTDVREAPKNKCKRQLQALQAGPWFNNRAHETLHTGDNVVYAVSGYKKATHLRYGVFLGTSEDGVPVVTDVGGTTRHYVYNRRIMKPGAFLAKQDVERINRLIEGRMWSR